MHEACNMKLFFCVSVVVDRKIKLFENRAITYTNKITVELLLQNNKKSLNFVLHFVYDMFYFVCIADEQL